MVEASRFHYLLEEELESELESELVKGQAYRWEGSLLEACLCLDAPVSR